MVGFQFFLRKTQRSFGGSLSLNMFEQVLSMYLYVLRPSEPACFLLFIDGGGPIPNNCNHHAANDHITMAILQPAQIHSNPPFESIWTHVTLSLVHEILTMLVDCWRRLSMTSRARHLSVFLFLRMVPTFEKFAGLCLYLAHNVQPIWFHVMWV